MLVGGVYYWYGVKYGGAVTYAASPTRLNSDTTFDAVACYSSTDLVHWKFENNVLPPGNLAPTWLGRMGVAYNATTKKYVLVSQYTGAQGSGELFATSSTPTGAFTVDHVQPTRADGDGAAERHVHAHGLDPEQRRTVRRAPVRAKLRRHREGRVGEYRDRHVDAGDHRWHRGQQRDRGLRGRDHGQRESVGRHGRLHARAKLGGLADRL
jgi:hypothetical protein